MELEQSAFSGASDFLLLTLLNSTYSFQEWKNANELQVTTKLYDMRFRCLIHQKSGALEKLVHLYSIDIGSVFWVLLLNEIEKSGDSSNLFVQSELTVEQVLPGRGKIKFELYIAGYCWSGHIVTCMHEHRFINFEI